MGIEEADKIGEREYGNGAQEPSDPFAGPTKPSPFLLQTLRATGIVVCSMVGGLLLISGGLYLKSLSSGARQPQAAAGGAQTVPAAEAGDPAGEFATETALADPSRDDAVPSASAESAGGAAPEAELAKDPRQIGVVKRQEIYRQVQLAERLANSHRRREVLEQHKRAIAEHYRITSAALREIQLEGLTLDWPEAMPGEQFVGAAPVTESASGARLLTAISSRRDGSTSAAAPTPAPIPTSEPAPARPDDEGEMAPEITYSRNPDSGYVIVSAPRTASLGNTLEPGRRETATMAPPVAATPTPIAVSPSSLGLHVGDEIRLRRSVPIYWRFEFDDPYDTFKSGRVVPENTLLRLRSIDLLRCEVEVLVSLDWSLGTGWVNTADLGYGAFEPYVR